MQLLRSRLTKKNPAFRRFSRFSPINRDFSTAERIYPSRLEGESRLTDSSPRSVPVPQRSDLESDSLERKPISGRSSAASRVGLPLRLQVGAVTVSFLEQSKFHLVCSKPFKNIEKIENFRLYFKTRKVNLYS